MNLSRDQNKKIPPSAMDEHENPISLLAEAAAKNFNISVQTIVDVQARSQNWRSSSSTSSAFMCKSDAMIDHIQAYGGYSIFETETWLATQGENEVGVLMLAPQFSLSTRARMLGVPNLHFHLPEARDDVVEIVAMCAKSAPGIGQFLTLFAMAYAGRRPIILQLHRVFESVPLDPNAERIGVVSEPVYSLAAQHILQKFGFMGVEAETTDDHKLNSAFYYRPAQDNDSNFEQYVRHWVQRFSRPVEAFKDILGDFSFPDPMLQPLDFLDDSVAADAAFATGLPPHSVFHINPLADMEYTHLSASDERKLDAVPLSFGLDTLVDDAMDDEAPMPTFGLLPPGRRDDDDEEPNSDSDSDGNSSTTTILNSPRKKKTPRTFWYNLECPVCGKTFVRRSAVTRHLKSHYKDNPDNQLQCEFCGKTFVRPDVLQDHKIRRHIKPEPKPFICPFQDCDYRGRTQSDLTNHLRTHTKRGEQPPRVEQADEKQSES